MGVEMNYLVWSAALCGVLWLPYIAARAKFWGLPAVLGYPDDPPQMPNWVKRSERAHLNMVENLPIFAVLVLAAHTLGAFDAQTAMGAMLFFWGRVAHAAILTAGIPYLRTLAFLVSWAGMVLIFLRLIG